MSDPPRCFVCEDPARIERTDRTVWLVHCRRCGRYEMTWALAESKTLRHPDNQRLLSFLSAALRQATERGQLLNVTTDNWQTLAEGHARTPVHRKLDLVLEYFAKRSEHPGAYVGFDPEDFPLIDAGSPREVPYYTQALEQQGFLQRRSQGREEFRVTPTGWTHLNPVDPGGVPGTCFVAMAFDPSLDPVYDGGFSPAIEACGLRVVRVDKLQHNGVVTDVILAEIRRAQLVIADVTLQRQGVYYEAGFALGLGRIVIWCCRQDEIARVHFDTRQYSHVVWTDGADLRAKLEARIRATVPIPVNATGRA